MSRLTSIFDDGNSNGAVDTGETVYTSYKYLGAGQIVKETEAGATLSYLNSNDSNVTGLDRFGRVVDQVWKDSSGNLRDEYKYGYDRAGNRWWKENLGPNAAALDELYAYDDLGRLTDTKRGTLDITTDPATRPLPARLRKRRTGRSTAWAILASSPMIIRRRLAPRMPPTKYRASTTTRTLCITTRRAT